MSSTDSDSSSEDDSNDLNPDLPPTAQTMNLDKPPEKSKTGKSRKKLGDEERNRFSPFCAKCCFWMMLIGCCGCHRCYLGYTWRGFLMWITLGFCLVGQCKDLCELQELIDMANRGNHRTPRDEKCWKIIGICICIACMLSPV